MEKWYTSHRVRSLVDMHIPNGNGNLSKFDPVRYAQNVERSGASVAYVYSRNCLGLNFYPTEYGMRHQEAERDIFGETVKECRKRGLKVVGYTNTWATFVADAHPEWQSVYGDGHRRRDNTRFGTPCVNNDDYVAYVCKHVKELVSRYQLDGLWMDMIGICTPVCFCKSCQQKYGKPLPRVIDPDDPGFYEYLDFKAKAVRRYLEEVRAAAKSVAPNITVTYQSGAWRFPLKYGMSVQALESFDYLSGDFYTDRVGVNTVCRMLYKASPSGFFEFMTSRCVDLEYHTMNKDIGELTQQAYAAMMLGGAFLFIDAIDPDGGMNDAFYDEISIISRLYARYEPYLDHADRPVREVAVYYNLPSWLSPADQGKEVDRIDGMYLYHRLEKICDTLCRNHVDHDLLCPRNLSELKNYKVVILSSLGALSEEEVRAIRAYVKEGGRLYVSGATGIRDEKGRSYEDFALSDVLGAHFKGYFDKAPGYIAPVAQAPLFGRYTRKHPHMLRERMVKTEANEGAQVLATVMLPFSDARDHLRFSSAISDPPAEERREPAILQNRYGEGRVIYSAGRIEDDPVADNEKLFLSLLHTLLEEPRVQVQAHSCVDHVLYEGENVLKLHLLNHQKQLPVIPLSDIRVDIRLQPGQRVREVRDALGGEIAWSVADDVLTICTGLDEYKIVLIELEAQ